MAQKVQRRAVTKTAAVEIPLRYLTIPAAATYLASTVWAVRQLISTRKIPFIKIGKRFVLDTHDLDLFFEQQKGSMKPSLTVAQVRKEFRCCIAEIRIDKAERIDPSDERWAM